MNKVIVYVGLFLSLFFSGCRERVELEFEVVEAKDFYPEMLDADTIEPLSFEFCRDCYTMDKAIEFETSIGSKELTVTNKMRHEWELDCISVRYREMDFGEVPREFIYERLKIFLRPQSPFSGYSMAVVYYRVSFEDPNVNQMEAVIYPGDNFFGYHKRDDVSQSYRNITFPQIQPIAQERFLTNYISILKWMETFVSKGFKLEGAKYLYNGSYHNSSPGNRFYDQNVVYEEKWIEDMIFYSLILYHSLEEVQPISFKVQAHAPLKAYYNAASDDIASSYYQLDVEDLAFRIKFYNDYIDYLPE
ncbi:MAG: hypothetical protein AAGC47_10375 [Bacteroidota bacterium]